MQPFLPYCQRALLGLLLFASPGSSFAAPVPVTATAKVSLDSLTQAVEGRYNRASSLSMHFVENYDGLGLHRREEGTLLLKKPGRMRWSYSSPQGKIFLVDGKTAWFYTPGAAQAQRIPASQLDDLRSPLRLLLGRVKLRSELNSITLSPAREPGQYLLAGVPKGLEKRLSSLQLTVTGDGTILFIRIEELDGSVTGFALTDQRLNAPASDRDFLFTPPAGVPIVSGLPPV